MATDRITSQSEPSVHVRNVNEVSARKAGKLVYVVSLSAVSRPVGPDVSRLGVKSEKYATLSSSNNRQRRACWESGASLVLLSDGFSASPPLSVVVHRKAMNPSLICCLS